ncbi:MAG: CHAT domain-containing tetratricopeptide repeat protein [Chitinophagales bacterium]
MKKSRKIYLCLLLVILFLNQTRTCIAKSDTTNINNKPSELELKENYAVYIVQYPKLLDSLKRMNNWNQVAEEMYNLSECFFQLKLYDRLNEVLEIAKSFCYKYNLSAFNKLRLTEQKSLCDHAEYKKCIKNLYELLLFTSSLKEKNSILLLLGSCYYQLDDLDNSRSCYEIILKNHPNFLQLAQVYNGIGSCCFMDTQLDSAKYYYEKGLAILTDNKCDRHSRAGQIIMNLGYIDKEYGDYKNAKLKFNSILLTPKNNIKYSELYGLLGSLSLFESNYMSALLYLKKEKEILDNIYYAENSSYIKYYLNTGMVYFYIKNIERAEKNFINAGQLIYKSYKKYHYLNTFLENNYALIYLYNDNTSKAKKLLSEVIHTELSSKHPSEYLGDAYCLLGDCLLKEANPDDAILNYKKAATIYDKIYGDKNVYSIDAFIGLSQAFIQKKNYIKAIELANTAVSYTIKNKKIIYAYDHWEAMLQVLKCKKELFTVKQSSESIEDIIIQIKKTILEAVKIKNTFISINNQLHYAEKISELNKLGIYLLTHYEQKNKKYIEDNLLFFIENDRANILRNNVLNIKSNALLPKKYQDQEFYLKSRLNYFTTMQENTEDETKLSFSLNDSILFYNNQYEFFIKSLEQKFPKLYTYKYAQHNITYSQIQDYLTEKDAFLEYFDDNENYYCVAITQKNYKIFNCGNKTYLDSVITKLSASVQNKKYDIELASILGNKLIDKQINNFNWIIAPAGMLNEISFDALTYSKKTVHPDYFLYKHSIQYTFSAAIFCNDYNAHEQQEIQAFYPDFKNTDYAKLQTNQEQKSIQNLKNHVNFTDTAATANNFIKYAPKAKVIHIASHFIPDTIMPSKSILLFQPNMTKNSLSADDIKTVPLNAQLITLAACKSNYGEANYGEGLMNFSWSLYYAGAHNILASKWNAADKTTDNIIADFYALLKKGKSKSEAIQLAKINYLNKTDAIGAQPFFWANFILNGDASSVNIAPSFFEKYWLIPVFILLSYFVVLLFQKKLYKTN